MDDRNPAIGRAAFVCPYCKAFTQQSWCRLQASPQKDPPPVLDAARLRELLKEQEQKENIGEKPDISSDSVKRWLTAVEDDRPGVDDSYWSDASSRDLINGLLSTCYVCRKEAVWVGTRIVYPATSADVVPANGDLPADIRRDYEEASSVAALSPRAAAALLRLAIQKLCSFLLNRDGVINEMIAELVRQGLSPMVQRALDVVRVVGNESVHPGTIDLRDDQATAMQLFALVNIIAEAMISQPKHVEALYKSLPADKVAAIEKRDAKVKQL